MRYGDHPEYGHHIGGSDASGIVWKVGAGVTRWKPGDEVVIHCNMASYEDPEVHGLDPLAAPTQMIWGYETTWGSFAQFTKVQAQQLLPKPQNLTWDEAASYGLVYFTAYRMLITQCDIQAGDRVLIWGAAGGLGVFATQICKLAGRPRRRRGLGAEKGELVKQLGAVDYIDRNEFAGMMRKGGETARRGEGALQGLTRVLQARQGDPRRPARHRLRARRQGHVPHLGVHGQAVRQGGDLRGHHGLPARLRRSLPVDAPEGDHRLALRERLRVQQGQRADRVGPDPAGAVAHARLRGRPSAPADARQPAPGQDRDPGRGREEGEGKTAEGLRARSARRWAHDRGPHPLADQPVPGRQVRRGLAAPPPRPCSTTAPPAGRSRVRSTAGWTSSSRRASPPRRTGSATGTRRRSPRNASSCPGSYQVDAAHLLGGTPHITRGRGRGGV